MTAHIDLTNTVEGNNLLFERTADLLFFIDSGGRIRRVSPSLTAILGWEPGELLGRSFADFAHPDDRPATAAHICIDEAGDERVNFKNRIVAKDGTYRWVSWNGCRLGDEGIAIVIGRDITEEASADETIRDSEAKYRMLVEHATDGMAIVQDEIIRYANPRMAELDGSSVDVLIGSSIAQHIHPGDLAKVTERYRQRLTGEKVPALYKAVLMRRDGTPADAELNVCVVEYHGRPAALVMVHDLTAHKHIEGDCLARDDCHGHVVSEEGHEGRLRAGIGHMGPLHPGLMSDELHRQVLRRADSGRAVSYFAGVLLRVVHQVFDILPRRGRFHHDRREARLAEGHDGSEVIQCVRNRPEMGNTAKAGACGPHDAVTIGFLFGYYPVGHGGRPSAVVVHDEGLAQELRGLLREETLGYVVRAAPGVADEEVDGLRRVG